MAAGAISPGVILVYTACSPVPGTFACNSDAACVHSSEQGYCEATHVCSFIDTSCPSGRRYASYAGKYSRKCVDGLQGTGAPRLEVASATLPASVELGSTVTATLNVNSSGPQPVSFELALWHGDGSSVSAACETGGLPVSSVPAGSSSCEAVLTPDRLGTYALAATATRPGGETDFPSLADLSVEDLVGYDFETGLVGWANYPTSSSSIVSLTKTHVFRGQQGIALTFTSSAADEVGGVDVGTLGPLASSPPAGATVHMHIWLPADADQGVLGVLPYVNEDETTGWRFTSKWYDLGQLQTGTWNDVTVDVPIDATLPIFRMGLEVVASDAWSSTYYFDAVDW